MVASADKTRYRSDAVDLVSSMKYAASRRTSVMALEHARQDGREVVTPDDVRAVVRAALEQVAAETVSSDDDAEPTIDAEEVVASQPAAS